MHYATIIDSTNKIMLLTVVEQQYALSLVSCESEETVNYKLSSIMPCNRKNSGKKYVSKEDGSVIHYWDVASYDIKLLPKVSAEVPTEVRAISFSDILKYGDFMLFEHLAMGRLIKQFVNQISGLMEVTCPHMSRIEGLSEEEQQKDPLWNTYQNLVLRNQLP